MSRDVVPCTKYNGQNYDKERLMPKGCDNFDLNEISVTFSIKKTCISFIQKTLFKYNYLKTNLKSLFFLKFSSGASIKIGLVLNATGNAYDRYFASDNYYEAIRKFIHTIRNINETSSTKIILDIRIKGRANNYYRLKKIIDSRFCVISDLNQSMSNWAKSIDIAFYLSATSGFVSLIDKSVPVVSLYDSDLYFFSDEIIQAPKDIIPSLTTDELISLIFSNKDSFYELKTKQRRWLNAQRC
jgi:hypothetical protein